MTFPSRSTLATFAAALALLITAAAPVAAETYGEGLSGEETVAIADLLASPDDWIDKRVRVEGTINDVCPKRGCWIQIRSADGEAEIQFKVKDGVIVFPKESVGETVIAEGVFTRLEMTEEQAVAWYQHVAEEKGETFDPSTVKGPQVLYRLKGIGAVTR